MFVEFLYPLGLLAALGIGIPIALHLWRVTKQRVLRVGNINVFARAKQQRIQKLRIKNWPLLIIRCLIVLMLAALLAGPRFIRDIKQQARGWVLLGPQHHTLLDPAQQKRIDSLLDNGYALHAFEPGFRSLSPQSEDDTVASAPNQFALIHQLNAQLPTGFPTVIFSKPEITRLAGDLPTTPLMLSWYALRDDTANAARFIARAWKTGNDSVAVLAGTSRTRGTHFDRITIKGDGQAEGIAFRITDGQAQVKFPEQTAWVAVTDTPYTVQFIAGSNAIDLAYVKAVFIAFAQQTGIQVAITDYDPSAPCDLLFDFSGLGITDTAHSPKTVFRYATGEVEQQQNNHIVPWGTATNGNTPKISRLIIAEDDTDQVVWADAYDRPVLTRNRGEHGWRYRFYGRFNPQWTDLVWSTAMVNNLLPLLLSPETPLWTQSFSRPTADRQTLPGPLLLPTQTNAPQRTIRDRRPTAMPLLTWMALLTFALERILTHRQRKNQTDG